MANPGDFSYTVKQQADIVRIISEYVQLRKSGGQNLQGLCPFHKEKTPSFSVHQSNQFFHCFGCGISGDVFTFVQKIENVTFPEAVRYVAEKMGIPLPKITYASPEEARQAKQRGGLLDIHEAACNFFRDQLRRPEAAHAREYLASRGVTPDIIDVFRIGFAPDRGFMLRDALANRFDEELLLESGLFSWKERDQSPVTNSQSSETANRPSLATVYSKFRNRVMFPICNEQGKVIAFTGRTLAADEKSGPKYLNSPETAIYSKSRVLFNLDKAKDPIRNLGYAILVEGQMDCISVYTAGFRNVIASSGTAFTEPQARLLGRFSKNIVVNFDPDTAGAAAAERSLALLVSEDFQIKVLTLETGFDPDLFIRRKGKDAYAKELNRSAKYFDYLIERARSQFPYRTPEGKVKALNFLMPHVQQVPSGIVRDEIANEIAHRLAIDSALLRQELRRVAGNRTGARISPRSLGTMTEAERVLIRALAHRGLNQAPVTDRDGQDLDFEPARQAHYALSQERLHAGCSTERLIDMLLTAVEENDDPMDLTMTEAERKVLATVLIDETEQLTPELLETSIQSLRRRAARLRLDELQQQIKEAERRNDKAEATRLAQERFKLRTQM